VLRRRRGEVLACRAKRRPSLASAIKPRGGTRKVRAAAHGLDCSPIPSTASAHQPAAVPCQRPLSFTVCRVLLVDIAILLQQVPGSYNRILPLPSSFLSSKAHVMLIASPWSSTMPDLNEVLQKLALTEYFQILTENGFHNWETVAARNRYV
jgi:hypothetical protein